ncbi:hypothetical protein ACFSBG_17890 [Georgenia yuyongxinii]|nr:hypothetical protein [Georgenia yuyongxinii]
MQVDKDKAWRSKGATGYGARLLLELARRFTEPVGSPGPGAGDQGRTGA